MKIVIRNIENIEQGREIGQTVFIRANSKQIENICKGVDKLTELIFAIDSMGEKWDKENTDAKNLKKK
jgi:hypothetical protein